MKVNLISSQTRQLFSKALNKFISVRKWPSDGSSGEVLILHGLGDHSGWHGWAADLLAAEGFSSAGFDWPGNGASDGKRGDMPTVDEACVLLDEIVETLDQSPIGIFAHSTGGFLVLHWLARRSGSHPSLKNLRWLWLSSPLINPAYGQSRVKIALALWLGKYFPKITLSTGVQASQCFHLRSESDAEAERQRHGGHHRISLRFGASLLTYQPQLFGAVAHIRPDLAFLLTQGTEDTVCPPKFVEALFSHLPGRKKSCLFVSGARHEPFQEENSADLARSVRNWIKNH